MLRSFSSFLFLVFFAHVSCLSDEKRQEGKQVPSTTKLSAPLDRHHTHWISSDGSGAEFWVIQNAAGETEIKGRDTASSYSGVLEARPAGSVACRGEGFQYISGNRFDYQSTFTVVEIGDQTQLHEKWTATFASGKVISGEGKFIEVKEDKAGE